MRIAVMVSGHSRGSNLQAILADCARPESRAEVALVIGTRGDSAAMDRARAAGIRTAVVSPRRYEQDEEGYGAAILRHLRSADIELVCLAGYMRILPASVVRAYRNRVLNIHPALLPLFGGKGMYGEHVHRAVLASGVKVSGATVHLVDETYDSGPIVLQIEAPVLADDTPATLAARVLAAEHAAYTRAIRLFAAGCIKVVDARVQILEEPSGD